MLNSGALEVTRQSRRLRNDCFPVSCARRSRQVRWLRRLMRRLTPNRCVIAYWHHPRYSSANPGPSPELRHVYQALYRGGAELALVGHSHSYERFAPMDGRGRRRPPGGARVRGRHGRRQPREAAARARPRQPLLRPQPGLWSARAEAPPAWLPLPLRSRGRRDARPRPWPLPPPPVPEAADREGRRMARVDVDQIKQRQAMIWAAGRLLGPVRAAAAGGPRAPSTCAPCPPARRCSTWRRATATSRSHARRRAPASWPPTSHRGWWSAAAPARRPRATTSSGSRRTRRSCPSRTSASTASARCSAR